MQSLHGKVALVTGAGRGLGRACAQMLGRAGARVIVGDIDIENGEETARLIRDAGAEAIAIEADISVASAVKAMVDAAMVAFGRLDCAINNAVLDIRRTPLAEIEEEAWDRALAVNLSGVFLCMKHEIRAMLAGGGGSIVNIGSANEHTGMAGLSWYLGAKQGIYGLTKCAALDYGGQGIRVNAVAPGPMWTPALRETARMRPNHIEEHIAHIPVGRIGEPEDVAEAAVWLCSPAASFVTGHTLSADGGYILV